MDTIDETTKNLNISGSSDLEVVKVAETGSDTHKLVEAEDKPVGNPSDIPMDLEDELLGSSDAETIKSNKDVSGTEHSDTGSTTSGLRKLKLDEKRKRPSGAEMRKRRREKKSVEAGKGTGDRESKDKPKTPTPEGESSQEKSGGDRKSGDPRKKTTGAVDRKLRKEREPGTSVTSLKRGRSDTSTPESVKKSRPLLKKGRSDGTQTTFKDALTIIKTAVVPEDYPKTKLTEEQSTQTQQAILDKIKPGMAVSPQFQGAKFEQGALLLYCSNEETWSWLYSTVDSLKPWDGANLKVILAKDLQSMEKVIFTAPRELKEAKPDVIFKKIEGQNGGLSTEDWKVLHTKQTDNGQTIVCLIDAEAVRTLETRGMFIFLGFNKVKLALLGKKKEE